MSSIRGESMEGFKSIEEARAYLAIVKVVGTEVF